MITFGKSLQNHDTDVELPTPIVDTNMDANSLDRNIKVKGCTKAGITIKVKKKNKKLIKKKRSNSYTKNMKSDISPQADNSDSLLNNSSTKSLDHFLEKKSKFMTLVETFNIDNANCIVEHFDELEDQLRRRERYDKYDPLTQLKKYISSAIVNENGLGEIAIKYQQKNGRGRFQAMGPSLQGLPREIRHTISRDLYFDIDMVNAHPVILQWMCRNQGFDSKYLDRYIKKREFYLEKLISKNKISRDEAKRVYLAITNGGSGDYKSLKYKSSHLESYKEEMTGLHKKFADLNPERFQEVKAKRIKDKKNYNHEAALMNCLMLDIENDCLMVAHSRIGCKTKSLQFDGMQIFRCPHKGSSLERDPDNDCGWIEGLVSKKLGISTNWKVKPMNNHLDLSKYKIKKSEKIKIHNFSSSDDNLSKCFCELYGHEFMYVFADKEGLTGYFYYFNGVYWVRDLQNMLICNRLGNDLYLKLCDMINIKIHETSDENFRKVLSKTQYQLICLQSSAKKEAIIRVLKRDLFRRVKLDANLKIIVFKNGAYDFDKFEFRNTKPEEFITDSLNTGYDYEESDKKDILKFSSDYIDKILINPKEDKDVFLKLLSTSLTGLRIKKYIIANGSGDNGKSGLYSLLKRTLGDYAYKINPKEVCQGKKDGFTLNNIHKKRLVYAEEPDSETQIIDGSFIKDITGGDSTCFRKIHTNETDVDIHCLLCIPCNSKPPIKPFDNAIRERTLDFPFLSTFTNYDINNKDRFKGNQYYDSDEFRIANRLNLFHYLLPYLNQFFKDNQVITLSKNLRNRRDEYLLNSDHFYKWFSETYEIIDDTNIFIGMKQLFSEFKQSEFYKNLSKKEKRENTYRAFCDRMLGKKPIRKIYREDHRPYIDGKQKRIRNCLIGLKLRDDPESESDVDMETDSE